MEAIGGPLAVDLSRGAGAPWRRGRRVAARTALAAVAVLAVAATLPAEARAGGTRAGGEVAAPAGAPAPTRSRRDPAAKAGLTGVAADLAHRADGARQEAERQYLLTEALRLSDILGGDRLRLMAWIRSAWTWELEGDALFVDGVRRGSVPLLESARLRYDQAASELRLARALPAIPYGKHEARPFAVRPLPPVDWLR